MRPDATATTPVNRSKCVPPFRTERKIEKAIIVYFKEAQNRWMRWHASSSRWFDVA